MNIRRFHAGLKVLVYGHLLNWPWRSRLKRRRVRGAATADAVSSYLNRYVPEFRDIPEDKDCGRPEGGEDRIFSIWLQGESDAPAIVKACWRSIRANCSQELVILDAESIGDWIELPDHIMEKWRSGKMRHAHFADICRVELLYRYGGLWLDSTDFVCAELPQWILDEDFFVYMGGDTLHGSYAFIQNCFIRGTRGNYLLKAWREAMFAYWREEDSAIDYFVHQMLFRKVVESNRKAAELFDKMPKVPQDATHWLWFYGNADRPFDRGKFEDIIRGAAFQKTEYKSSSAMSPRPGSFAEAVVNMYME